MVPASLALWLFCHPRLLLSAFWRLITPGEEPTTWQANPKHSLEKLEPDIPKTMWNPYLAGYPESKEDSLINEMLERIGEMSSVRSIETKCRIHMYNSTKTVAVSQRAAESSKSWMQEELNKRTFIPDIFLHQPTFHNMSSRHIWSYTRHQTPFAPQNFYTDSFDTT